MMMIEQKLEGGKRAMDHERSAKHKVVRSDTSFSKDDGTIRQFSKRQSRVCQNYFKGQWEIPTMAI